MLAKSVLALDLEFALYANIEPGAGVVGIECELAPHAFAQQLAIASLNAARAGESRIGYVEPRSREIGAQRANSCLGCWGGAFFDRSHRRLGGRRRARRPNAGVPRDSFQLACRCKALRCARLNAASADFVVGRRRG